MDTLGLARKDDKQTSHDGAEHIKPRLNDRKLEFMSGLRALGGRATAKEVASNVYPGEFAIFDSIRKRAIDCVRLGWVREVEPRECKVSGRKCTVYEIIEIARCEACGGEMVNGVCKRELEEESNG